MLFLSQWFTNPVFGYTSQHSGPQRVKKEPATAPQLKLGSQRCLQFTVTQETHCLFFYLTPEWQCWDLHPWGKYLHANHNSSKTGFKGSQASPSKHTEDLSDDEWSKLKTARFSHGGN